jgi:hypothetical protein
MGGLDRAVRGLPARPSEQEVALINFARLIDARNLRLSLADDGWFSPDTYSRQFMEIIDGPAVYLFLAYQNDVGSNIPTYGTAMVAYVGMSMRLSRRLDGHQILSEVQRAGFWPMRWFKPTLGTELRTTERHLIKKFDPPWNILGRCKGVY